MRTRLLSLAALLPLCLPLTAQAGSCDLDVVLPDGFADVEGSWSTGYPWNATPQRVMYCYGRAAAGFDRPVRIRGVRYRSDAAFSQNFGVDYDFRLDVSTSRNPAANLDYTFDNNHGADRVTVFDGVQSLPAASGWTTSPRPFVLEVPFDTVFEWDPRSGPLLFDIRMRGVSSGPGVSWDAVLGGSDVGRIAATTGGANATTANYPGGSVSHIAALVVELCLEVDVAPVALTAVEGASSSSYPFNRATPMRVQYAYDASVIDFVGRHKISALSFRTDNGAAFGGNSYDMLITMSTGSVAANALSATFDANHGADLTAVFDGVHVAPPAAGAAAAGPFMLTIPLQTPFEYNPANGPLIIDIRLLTGVVPTVGWDGAFGTEPTYRVYNISSASAASGTVQHFGLTLGLSAEPCPTIPEADDSVFGNSSSSYPWNTGPQRVMYQYGPSAIATDRPLYIQHLSWRPRNAGPFGPATYTCVIDLSTSAVAVGAMTPAFNNNHGSDRARVFNGTFSVPYMATNSDPTQFPISVKLDQPFFYDPANGPLLVDIVMLLRQGATAAVDGSFTPDTWRIANLNDPYSNLANYPSSGNPQGFGLSIRLTGEGCNATSINYGVACAGTNGTPSCVNLGLPTLPSPDFAIGMRDGPVNSFGFLVIGVTATNIPLAVIGAPGCSSLTPGEIGAFAVPTSPTGWAQYALPLPNNGAFAGFEFATQWVSLDAGANNFGLVYSDAQSHMTCY